MMNTNNKPKFSKGWLTGLVLGVATSLGVLAYAAVTIPHTFKAGDTIIASEVNANFQALANNLSGGDQNVTVTCTPTDTIGAALANAAPAGKLIITVNGTCTEDVIIERDHVTLKDGTVAGTGAAQPVIQILGARGIVIDNMTVQGGASDGIFATRNADVTIVNTTVQNNARTGVVLRWGAFADISGSTISGNAECAVSPRDGAKVLLTNNPLITTAQPSASICSTIGAYRSTTVRLAGGNTINNTGGGAVMDINLGSALRASTGVDTISGRILIDRLTSADLRNVIVTGDMSVRRGSWLRLRAPSSVTGNIDIGATAIAEFQSVPTISGTVTCRGSVTVGLSPNVDLTLVDSLSGNVVTSEGGVAFAFRGIAVGNIAGGLFNGCN